MREVVPSLFGTVVHTLLTVGFTTQPSLRLSVFTLQYLPFGIHLLVILYHIHCKNRALFARVRASLEQVRGALHEYAAIVYY